jgi:hypothetical protein
VSKDSAEKRKSWPEGREEEGAEVELENDQPVPLLINGAQRQRHRLQHYSESSARTA